jgi:hypothetical protein
MGKLPKDKFAGLRRAMSHAAVCVMASLVEITCTVAGIARAEPARPLTGQVVKQVLLDAGRCRRCWASQ